jgi:hypothetical protein
MPTSKKGKGFRHPYLLAALGLFIIAVIGWQFYKYRIVNRGVNKTVSEKTKGLYSIHYDDLSLDEVAGALHVRNIEIEPDTAVFNQMVEDKSNPPMLIRVSIPSLDILGVKTPKALLTKEIEGGRVEVSNPTIEIELEHFAKDTTVSDPSKEIYKELLGKFLKIQVDSVEIGHANIVVRERGSKEMVFKANNVSFLLSDLLIDSISNKDRSRILFSRNLDIAADEIALPSKNKKYRLRVEKIRFTGRNNTFSIGSIRVVPQLTEEEFAQSFPAQKDRYDFTLEGVSLVHVNRESLWHKKIEADSLIVDKSSFKIYRDLSRPPDTVSKVGKYPQEQLMRMSVPLSIRRAVFVHSFIEYKEKNGKSDSAGKVQFFDVRATIDNITNIKEAISRNNKTVVNFKAKFLDKAPVDARLVMLLKDPKGRFTIEGNVGAIDVRSLNPLTQPMGLARMENGKIDKLHFNLMGTDSSSEGKVVMLYSGIKVSLLKKDKDENKYDKKGLVSLAANILIKKSNPENGGSARAADVHFRRILNKSLFNLIWKSIFTGIKETIGLKK